MRYVVAIIVIFGIAAGVFFFSNRTTSNPTATIYQSNTQDSTLSPSNAENDQKMQIIAEGLDTPWSIAILPDKTMLVTERAGRVRFIDSSGKLSSTPVATIESVKEFGEGGLMGMAIHPNFSSNNYVYLYYTYSGSGNDTLNRVVRMTFKDQKLSDEKVIVDQIPGAIYHNGGRIKFGPDKNLYIGTGDANQPSQSQNKDSLAGKILRVNDQGKAVSGNPFNTEVFSYGHRNVQGLAWNTKNEFWSTEHGPSGGGLGFGNDEINFVESSKNYGWPEIQGDQSKSGMITPVKNSGTNSVWAPAGATFLGDSLFFGGLRGEALYEAKISDGKVTELKEYFKGELGRIRDVVLGPDNMLYITTSNHDGRGTPRDGDDKIIRINPTKL